MGYFPNGTAGEMYYARWCARCIHEREIREGADGPGCAVWGAHLLWNYEDKQKKLLDWFIPRSEDRIDNEQCKMFRQVGPAHDPDQIDMFRPPMKEEDTLC